MKPLSKITLALLLITGIPACEKGKSDSLCKDLPPPSPESVKVTGYGISKDTVRPNHDIYFGQEVMAKDSLTIHLEPRTTYAVAQNT